jgi:hypothetical protein
MPLIIFPDVTCKMKRQNSLDLAVCLLSASIVCAKVIPLVFTELYVI